MPPLLVSFRLCTVVLQVLRVPWSATEVRVALRPVAVLPVAVALMPTQRRSESGAPVVPLGVKAVP